MAVSISEVQIDPNDPTKNVAGGTLASQVHFAWANGGLGADTFSLSDISSATQTLMNTNQRGLWVGLGAGDDTATGTGFGDNFDMGSGTNYVDGGANAGTAPWGAKATDTLDVFVADATAASAVAVTALSASSTGADLAAFNSGYTAKVSAGAETDYIKNIENVNVQVWNDANNNGRKDWGSESITFAKNINLAMNVNEIKLDPNDSTKVQGGATLASQMHFAWANGGLGADTFSLSDISSATQTLMNTNQRGLWVGLGAGDDTATGTGFGDNFDMGSGTNYVDGGANAGTAPWGAKATDTLDVFVADATAASAVAVTALSASSTGADLAAFNSGYTAKVSAGAETDYIKNIENVNVQVWNDANNNGQKDWGSEVTFAKNINLAMNVNEIKLDPNDSTKVQGGATLASQMHFAWANGGLGADTFSLSDISSATQTLMNTNQRGLWVGLGAGDDTATGTGFGDNFDMGSGTNYVDGGANAGTAPWGAKATDTLDVFVADATAASAVAVTALSASSTGADLAAFNSGYTAKVSAGAETDYIKNIENVNVQVWNDANNNGRKDWGSESITFAKNINLAMNVNEIKLDPNDSTKVQGGATLASQMHFAWANGGLGADTFSLSDISSATQTLMNTNQRGLWVGLGAGDDTATGTGFGDNFDMGSGTNYVDGGANAGTAPWGAKATDTLDVFVADATAASAVAVTALSASSTGADLAAFNSGYTAKVSAGAETDYIKNIENVNVQVWNDANNNGRKDWGSESITFAKNINLAMNVNEIKLDPNDSTKVQGGATLASQMHFAWANGGLGADTFSLSDISSATQTLMNTNQRGLWVGLGAGDDTATGTGFGDNFDMGSGTNYVDGGANAGTAPWGAKATDTLDVFVADATAASAVAVTALSASSTGADLAAFNSGYTAKVSAGAETDYIKNIENVNVQVWNDANNNGQKDWGSEVTFAKNINLAMNVNEIKLDPNDSTKVQGGATLASQVHFAWANGGLGADTFSLSDISSATQTLMNTNQRGLWVGLGAGDDTATGTGFGDNFDMGSGTNYVDGGANAGTAPWGAKATDTLDVFVADATAASAVAVTALSASSTGADLAAFNSGYTAKVSAGAETDYIKNIENVNVQVWNDANNNGRKDWGSESITFAKNINLTMNVNEIKLDPNDSTKVQGGATLASQMHYAWVNGTAGADTFSISDITNATQTLMTTNQRGLSVMLGAGEDTATGTGFGDNFDMGSGTNYVDGGANAGTNPWGSKAADTLDVFVANSTAANAVTVAALTSGMSGTDATAYTDGYTAKVTSGSDVNYIKNIEAVNVQIWTDANSNGQKDYGSGEVTSGKYINLVPTVFENISPSQFTLGSVTGTFMAETVDLSTGSPLISSALATGMTTYGRGINVDMTSGGGDTVVGTGYGDTIAFGNGINYADGGANAGSPPSGGAASDSLQVFVANASEANAVAVTQLTSGLSGTDASAYTAGYAFKVVSGGQTDYVKNIENVNVQIWNDANSNGLKDYGSGEVTNGPNISLQVSVSENISGDAAALAARYHLGFVGGTKFNDTVNISTGSPAISSNLSTAMATYGRGLYFNLGGGGDDTVVGSAYGDNFWVDAGTNFVDGGDNGGYQPGSTKTTGIDTLEVWVKNTSEAAAVSVTKLSGADTGADLNAFNGGYTFKVVNAAGNEVDYIKNVERVNVSVWNDANANNLVDAGETVQYSGRALNTYYQENVPSPSNQTPVLGFAFGSNDMGTGQFADQISGDAVLTALGKTFNAANPFGAFVFAMGGNDTVVGTAGTDFAVTTQFGSHLVDGGADAGYFNYASGSPVISGDQYRLLEQKLVPKDASGATNGGYVAADVTTTNYRMVNLQQWAGFATNPLSAISGTLNNRLTGNAIDSTDLGNISATASSLGLTGVGGNGYTWAVVKYAVGGSLLGVDFLKNIETVQFGLFYDSNRNDIAQGSIGETLTPATLSYTIANDSYTLTEAQKTWLNLGGSDHVGLVNGTTFNDTIDLSALSVPSYQTGNGFVANGLNGNDTIIGSSGGDILIGGGAIDTITTGSGVDIVNFTGVTLAGGRDVVTDFTVGTDGIAIMASSTSAGTAVGTTAVVANVSAAATNASGAAFDLAAALTPATNTVDLVTLSASALTNKANANLASSTDGTDLLKALVALGGGNTASGIQVDGIGHTFYLAVDDGTNGYLYLANSGADNLVTAGEVALIGTFNNAQISGLDSAHVGLV